jgi:hypothetical protein
MGSLESILSSLKFKLRALNSSTFFVKNCFHLYESRPCVNKVEIIFFFVASLSLLAQVFSSYNAFKSELESSRLFLQNTELRIVKACLAKDNNMVVDEPHRGMLVPIPSLPRLLLV